MRSHELTHAGLRLARWRNRHNLRQATFWTMVALGPLLAIATTAVLSDMQWLGGGKMLRPSLCIAMARALGATEEDVLHLASTGGSSTAGATGATD